MGHCSTMMRAEMTMASAVDSPNSLALSWKSPLPHVCAVMPDVLMRRNPKFQYTRLNIIAPTATAPIKTLSPRCPAMAVSTRPSNGTVMLATIAGNAILNISRFMPAKVHKNTHPANNIPTVRSGRWVFDAILFPVRDSLANARSACGYGLRG